VLALNQAIEAIEMLSLYGKSNINKLLMFDGMTFTWLTFKVPIHFSFSHLVI
jgi:adenylyltransferase/sulfurtransferase